MPDDDSESLALVGEEDPLSEQAVDLKDAGTKKRQSTKFCAERRRLTA